MTQRTRQTAEIVLCRKDLGMALPQYKTAGAAGFDIVNASGEDLTLSPGEVKVIPSGIKVKVPMGYVGMLTPRSGKSITGFSVNNAPGIIDDDYRDEIATIAINNSNNPITISHLERIAQLVVVPYVHLALLEVGEFTPDEFNDRNGGMGSTGSH